MEENFPMKNVTRRNSDSTDSKRINTEERNHRVIEIGPPDTFLLVHLLFLLLGIMHLLPTTFFVTANDYWMYKFRSISSNNTNDRSDLQSNFASGSNIASTVPSVVCMVLATVFGYKMKLRTRIYKNSSFYNFHYEKNPEDTKKDIICFVEFKDVSKKIWSSLAIGMAGALAYAPTHPAVAALVVSEFRGNENDWNGRSWFCLKGSLVGRIVDQQDILFVPLFMFCNTLPRNHLPVLFPHDWQYVIILGSFMISSGYFFNIAFMNVTRLAPEDEETSYLIMQTFIGIVSAAFSPLGFFALNYYDTLK
ncbi:uncharacterized protein [Leptinotarsa decemlineata]|uniref:uncharacterized protein n=1 Tax=Leptinotarsa decemlineata TaxID=7539 RepID=UPI003D306C10